MQQPLVTIVCLCYNHERFVAEAIDSVLKQTYPRIQLIVIDNGSTDGSVSAIRQFIKDKPEILYVGNDYNKGSCRAFNEALLLAKGAYVIDLAADDVLHPERVARGVEVFTKAGNEYGVHFTDAAIISEEGVFLHTHSDKYPHASIPQGDIYTDVIKSYFICTPTMMFRRAVLDELHGYDETLAFEDFDFWIRSARMVKYIYTPEALIQRRLVNTSMSNQQFVRASAQRWSTLEVCKKIKILNRSPEENKALKSRLRYEMLLSLRMLDFKLALAFLRLRRSLS